MHSGVYRTSSWPVQQPRAEPPRLSGWPWLPEAHPACSTDAGLCPVHTRDSPHFSADGDPETSGTLLIGSSCPVKRYSQAASLCSPTAWRATLAQQPDGIPRSAPCCPNRWARFFRIRSLSEERELKRVRLGISQTDHTRLLKHPES